MAKKEKSKKRKKKQLKYRHPGPKPSAVEKNTYRAPSWSTTLACVGGAVGCFHPVCGVVLMVGVWLVAC